MLQPRRYHGDRRRADRAEQRPGRRRRYRPPGQPARPRRRRADPEPVPHRPAAHGARGQGAHDRSRPRHRHAERADQHPAGRGGDAGVLRRLAALAVHGPDQPAGRADQQAPPLGAWARRPEPRPRRLRRARRSPHALRPDLPGRDAGRPEHRPDRLAGDLRARSTTSASSRRPTARCIARCRCAEWERRHARACAIWQRSLARRQPSMRHGRAHGDVLLRANCARYVDRSARIAEAGRRSTTLASGSPHAAATIKSPDRLAGDRLPVGRRGGAVRRRAGQRAARRVQALQRNASSPAASARRVRQRADRPRRLYGRLAEAGRQRRRPR